MAQTNFANQHSELVALFNGYNTTAFQGIENQYLCHPNFFVNKSSDNSSNYDINIIYNYNKDCVSSQTSATLVKTIYQSGLANTSIIISGNDVFAKPISSTVMGDIIDSSSFTIKNNVYDLNLIECLDKVNAITGNTPPINGNPVSSKSGTISNGKGGMCPTMDGKTCSGPEQFTNPSGPATLSTYNMMQGLYGWYNILASKNWKTFLEGNLITISNIDGYSSLSTTNPNSSIYTIFSDYSKVTDSASKTLWNCINNIVPISTIITAANAEQGYFDLYMMRRVFYSHILSLNFCIAASLYGSASGNAGDQAVLTTLLAAITALVQSQNNGLNNNHTLNDIYTDSNDKLINYNNVLKQVGDITSQLNKQKNDYVNNQKQYASSQSMIKIIIIYEIIIAIVLLVITTISTFIIFLNDDIPEAGKYIAAHVQIVLSILAIGLIIFRYNAAFRVQENYADFTTLDNYEMNLPQGQLQTSFRTDNNNTLLQNYASSMLDNILLFGTLSNIINNTLKVEKAYIDMGQIVNKELLYYTQQLEELIQENEKLLSAINLIKISSFAHKYRLYLMLFLAGLMSLTVELWVATGSQTILIFASIIGVIGFIIYVKKLSANVRTDADKYYWSVSAKNIDTLKNSS